MKRWILRILAVLLAPRVRRLVPYLPEERIVHEYVRAGATFGDTVSYLYMGSPIGMDRILNDYALWERAYASLGYHTISVDRFVEIGGWGKDPTPLLRQPAVPPTILHAEVYRRNFQGAHGNVLARVLSGEHVEGVVYLPSTEKAAKLEQQR